MLGKKLFAKKLLQKVKTAAFKVIFSPVRCVREIITNV